MGFARGDAEPAGRGSDAARPTVLDAPTPGPRHRRFAVCDAPRVARAAHGRELPEHRLLQPRNAGAGVRRVSISQHPAADRGGSGQHRGQRRRRRSGNSRCCSGRSDSLRITSPVPGTKCWSCCCSDWNTRPLGRNPPDERLERAPLFDSPRFEDGKNQFPHIRNSGKLSS